MINERSLRTKIKYRMHNVLSLIIRTKRSQDECRLIGFCAAIYILSGNVSYSSAAFKPATLDDNF